MGMLTRMLVPRSVRRAAHPVRTVRRAVTPRPIKQVRRAMHPIDNAVYSVERSLNTRARISTSRSRSSRRSRSSGAGWGPLLGCLIVLALMWWALTWPWMLATHAARRAGHLPGTSAYNFAGWAAEGPYLALLIAIAVTTAMTARRRADRRRALLAATPGWRHAPADPSALERWWDGSSFTAATRWNMEYRAASSTRPPAGIAMASTSGGGHYYSHGTCAVRHRTIEAAARCRNR